MAGDLFFIMARLGWGIATDDLFTPMDALDREANWCDVFHFRDDARALQSDLVAAACRR